MRENAACVAVLLYAFLVVFTSQAQVGAAAMAVRFVAATAGVTMGLEWRV